MAIRVGDVVTGVYHSISAGRIDVIGRVASINDTGMIQIDLDNPIEVPSIGRVGTDVLPRVSCHCTGCQLVQSCYQPQVRCGSRLLSPADALKAYDVGTDPQRWAASMQLAVEAAEREAVALFRLAADRAVAA